MVDTPASAAVSVVDLALKAARAYDRPDLHARLHQARQRLVDPAVRVLVVGEFKQGKSLLVNALVNAPVCPVDDDIATAVPTAVRYADEPTVSLVRSGDEPVTGSSWSPPVTTSVPIAQLADYVSEAGNPGNQRRLRYAEVGLPRKLLRQGLVLVDTPGVGGLGSVHGASTMAALPTADAVVLVSDASQEYTGPELEFLRHAMRLCPNILCVLTKIDFYPQWRRIVDLNRGHLRAAGIEAELLPVSSTLRMHAIQTGDRTLNAESGFPRLIDFLSSGVVAQAEQLIRRTVAHDVLAVSEQLATAFRAELQARQNPDHAAALIRRLEEAKSRADELRKRSARWQQTLGDGVSDLMADIDYDLRDRLRQIGRQVDEAIEEGDPAQTWEQVETWLYQQVSEAASANYVWAAQRARWLASRVAEHFEEGGSQLLPALDLGGATSVLGKLSEAERPEMESFGVGQKALAALRGSYGGVLMFGMLGNMVVSSLAIINPFSLGMGVVLGTKTIRDERKRQLAVRRSAAKSAARRYLDDAGFQIGKDSRDMLRRIQRTLRDHFTTQAEELHRCVGDSLAAAQRAVTSDKTERDQRIRDLRAELERLDALDRRARALTEVAGLAGLAGAGK
ncbi:MAG: dynamin family protein [Egibacteraceae bacterium]